jgi:hypothetical protein
MFRRFYPFHVRPTDTFFGLDASKFYPLNVTLLYFLWNPKCPEGGFLVFSKLAELFGMLTTIFDICSLRSSVATMIPPHLAPSTPRSYHQDDGMAIPLTASSTSSSSSTSSLSPPPPPPALTTTTTTSTFSLSWSSSSHHSLDLSSSMELPLMSLLLDNDDNDDTTLPAIADRFSLRPRNSSGNCILLPLLLLQQGR